MSVSADPRWAKFNGEGLSCACGERHVGLFPLQMIMPAGWEGPKAYAPDEDVRFDGTFLSANYAVLDGKYFALRMRLPLPIRDEREQALLFTVWASLDRPDFEAYVAAAKAGQMKQGARAHARLINRIGGFPDTLGLMGVAAQQTDGPPYILIDLQQQDKELRADHPLGREQRQGIALDRVFEIYAANGHDMRGALSSN